MKILFVMDSFFTGGAEYSTLILQQYLQEQGVSIQFVLLKKAKTEYDPVAYNLKKEQIQYISGKNYWQKISCLKKHIHRFKPDIVHSVLFSSNLLVRLSKIFGCKFTHIESLVNHTYSKVRLNDPGITNLKLNIYRYVDKYSQIWGTDHFHANGFSVSAHYQEKLGILPNKITVIHRGRSLPSIDKSFSRNKVKGELNIAAHKKVLINVARHEYQKGHDILLKAILKLKYEDFVLLLVGREGKTTSFITEFIRQHHLEERIIVLRHRIDIPELLAASDVFVFPSRYEGLPGVLIEAESMELPIVCTELPMMLEVAEKNRNCLTFPLEDVSALANAIDLLLSDETMMKSMGAESKLIFTEKFEINHIHKKMLLLYQQLMVK